MTNWNQGDKQWGLDKLGLSNVDMAQAGCYSCYCARALASYQKIVDPGTLCTALDAIGGYGSDGMLDWDAISKLYPDCFLYDSQWTTNFPNPNTQREQILKTIADVKRRVSMGFVVGLCVACPASLGTPNHIVACDYAPDDLGQWMIADSAYGDYVSFESRYGSPLQNLYGIRVLVGPPTQFPSYSTPQDKEDGNAAWKASMVYRGKDVTHIYSKEILDNIMAG